MEFALIGVAFLGFLMAILNLGLLGFSFGALARGVQGGARAAAYTANQYVANGSYTCPSACQVETYFNSFAAPALPASDTSASSNPRLTISWVNNSTNATATDPPGLYVLLTGTYKWTPLGFAALGPGITLSISSVATVMGTSGTSATISCPTSC